ncbi:MAG: hypothetical protein GX682_04950 [Clostridiaceae bacterium]|nr:hypothetical protein [Clostridiaceae bacterium]
MNNNIYIKSSGITLVALIITIIILIILAGVSLNILYGKDGIITKAQLASFATEMKAIEEKVGLKKINNEVKRYLYDENIKIFDINVTTDLEMSDTLKKEIMYFRDNESEEKYMIDYNPENFYNYITVGENNKIEKLWIIDKQTAGGKENTYIYDENSQVVFKIQQTKIGSDIYHSYNATTIRNGKAVVDESIKETFESYDNGYYEPDFKGFDPNTTYIVYYSNNILTTNDNVTKILVTIKDYMNSGRKAEIQLNGEKYVAYDYNNKIWANAVTMANGVESWWVWIPRYSYNTATYDDTEFDILFTTIDNKVIQIGQDGKTNLRELSNFENYLQHPGFTITDQSKKSTIQLKGLWIAKFDASYTDNAFPSSSESSDICYAPDMTGYDVNNTYMVYYSPDFSKKQEVKLADYVADGSPKIKEFEGETYTLYDYNKKIWANIVTKANGIESWWVWIPRYTYNKEIQNGEFSIIFVDTNNKPIDTKTYGRTLPDTFILNEAFNIKDTDNTGKTTITKLKGLWIGKFDATYTDDASPSTSESSDVCYAPDMTGYDVNNTYMVYYSPDFTKKQEVKLADYLSQGSPKTKDVDGETYTLYDYNKKIWANIVTRANDIESWWVWIPRYAYKNEIQNGEFSIIFIDTNNKPIDTKTYGTELLKTYIEHPAFTIIDKASNTTTELKGLWIGKFDATYVDETYKDENGIIVTALNTDASGTNTFTRNPTDGHVHDSMGYGTKERYVSSSNSWCDAYTSEGSSCSNFGYYRYCSQCGTRLKYYWCKAHFDPNRNGRVAIHDEDI